MSFGEAFSFIPQWQRDDIMVSYAPKVVQLENTMMNMMFLVPGYGHRRWRLRENGAIQQQNLNQISLFEFFDEMGGNC